MKTKTLTILTLLLCGLAGTSYPNGLIVNPYIFKSATPSPTPVDTTAPTLLAAEVDVSGTVLTLTFNEAVTDEDWTTADLRLDGSPGVLFTYSSGDGSDSVVFTTTGGHGFVVHAKDELLLQITSETIRDAAGHLLDTVTNFPVINESNQ